MPVKKHNILIRFLGHGIFPMLKKAFSVKVTLKLLCCIVLFFIANTGIYAEVTVIKLPPPKRHSGAKFLRFIPRNEMDIAVANAAAAVVLRDDGEHFESVRIAIGAVAPTPLYVHEATAAMQDRKVTVEAIAEAADIARDAASPIDDMRGSIAQREHLVQLLVTRALNGAIARARGRE